MDYRIKAPKNIFKLLVGGLMTLSVSSFAQDFEEVVKPWDNDLSTVEQNVNDNARRINALGSKISSLESKYNSLAPEVKELIKHMPLLVADSLSDMTNNGIGRALANAAKECELNIEFQSYTSTSVRQMITLLTKRETKLNVNGTQYLAELKNALNFLDKTGPCEVKVIPKKESNGMVDYEVQKGDCLWDIASEKLSQSTDWPQIYERNKHVLGPNPDLIHPGQLITID